MARKPTLNADALAALGPAKLAQLVLDEAARSAPFRKIVNAALAGAKGPEAVAKQIDRRLSALERARSLVDWQKELAFGLDLEATLRTILDGLGPAAPELAVDRLLRFVATHEQVFERIDDSSGRIQGVYKAAVEGLAGLVAALRAEERRSLPERLQPLLREDSHGYNSATARSVVPLLPADVLVAWDAALAREYGEPGKQPLADSMEEALARHAATDLRQAIAEARGDLDAVLALERTKPPGHQRRTVMAQRLLAAGRMAEALDLVREGGRRPASKPDDGWIAYSNIGSATSEPVLLEARILDALDRKAEAQALRWTQFETKLDAEALRAHVQALGDFEKFAVLDRAFAHVMASEHRHAALRILLDWPRLDLAADVVVAHASSWDGQYYRLLGEAADALEDKHPLATTVLLRALLGDILFSSRSQAYGHGARYLMRLDALAKRVAASDLLKVGLPDHQGFRRGLFSMHRHKAAFWGQVQDEAPQRVT